jgi:SAM-dependent methyltransferase
MTRRPLYLFLAMFLTSCSVLALEMISTRLLTVAKGGHLAFLTISVAMFGGCAGAIRVLLRPPTRGVAGYAVAYALSIPLCFVLQVRLPEVFDPSFTGLTTTMAFFLGTALPYFLSGICISALFTSLVGRINLLYAVDLLGGALGTWLIVPLFQLWSGESSIVAVSAVALLAATALALYEQRRALLAVIALALAAVVGLGVAQERWGVLSIPPTADYEVVRWNPFSRVTAAPKRTPTAWGMSPRYRGPLTPQYWLEIDDNSGTPVIGFDGNLQSVGFLAYDITALPFHLRPNGSTAVLGAGGGKDALTAVLLGARVAYAVELNDLIVDLMRGKLKDFSGKLAERVEFVVADGRNWVAAQPGEFDLIQLAMVDNSAAFASGAIHLTENGLYTSEAWQTFAHHLSNNGVLAVSMADYREWPAEIFRCTALGAHALQALGIRPDARHFLLCRHSYPFKAFRGQPDGIFTFLLSKQPFSPEDVARFESINEQLGFEVVLPLRPGHEPSFAELTAIARGEQATRLPFSLEPPTDARPYFFFSLKPGDMLPALTWRSRESSTFRALSFLAQLLTASLVLGGLCLLVPWISLGADRPKPALTYFLLLGLGYMLVEFAVAQRLTMFLGHPTWSLCVVLSTMLLFSGLGSACSAGLRHASRARQRMLFVLVAAVQAVAAIALTVVTAKLESAGLAPRVLCSVLLLALPALLMGVPFPLGMSLVSPRVVAWCWALNGVGSLLAAPLGMAVGVAAGTPWVLGLGMVCYLGAALLLPSAPENIAGTANRAD